MKDMEKHMMVGKDNLVKLSNKIVKLVLKSDDDYEASYIVEKEIRKYINKEKNEQVSQKN